MGIRRIMPEIRSSDLDATRALYCDIIGLGVDMEMAPDFLMLSAAATPAAQLIVNDNGHAGLPPGIAIDVERPDEVDRIHRAIVDRGLPVVEPLHTTPWGIYRFSALDHAGYRVTIIAHRGET